MQLNIFTMRASEWYKGVHIFDGDDHSEYLGQSRLAGESTSRPPLLCVSLTTATTTNRAVCSVVMHLYSCRCGGTSVDATSVCHALFGAKAAAKGTPLAASTDCAAPAWCLHSGTRTSNLPLQPAAVSPLWGGACGQVFVPLTFGLFRQTARVNVSWLEPEFRDLQHTRDGRRVEWVSYNKGL